MRVIAAVILGWFGWLGCSSAQTAPELVGSWSASGALGDPGSPGPAWTKRYELRRDGSFVMTGYPPIRVTGRWKVVERAGARFRVVLTDQEMRMSERDEPSRWQDQDGWAVLDGDKLEWNGATFSRSR